MQLLQNVTTYEGNHAYRKPSGNCESCDWSVLFVYVMYSIQVLLLLQRLQQYTTEIKYCLPPLWVFADKLLNILVA